jgi:hypothetical protein
VHSYSYRQAMDLLHATEMAAWEPEAGGPGTAMEPETGTETEPEKTATVARSTQHSDQSQTGVGFTPTTDTLLDTTESTAGYKRNADFTGLGRDNAKERPLSYKERTSSLPAPLSLPKRFSPPVVKYTDQDKGTRDRSSSRDSVKEGDSDYKAKDDTEYSKPGSQCLPSQHPNHMPAYQQMLYNPHTGALLPFSAPAAPMTGAAMATGNLASPTYVMPVQSLQQYQPAYYPHLIPHQQGQQQQQQQHQQQHQQQQQIVYVRAGNGQLVPVLTPLSSRLQTHPNLVRVPASSIHNNSPSPTSSPIYGQHTTNSANTQPNTNKRQRVSPLSVSPPKSIDTAISAAERLQRQQIKLQQQLHPNLCQEIESKNISDIYNIDEKETNKPTVKGEILELQELDRIDTSDPASAVNNGSRSSTEKMTHETPSSRITGTLTLGGFTYKYSQSLSGNTVKDRALFDKLVDNAWKTCLAKKDG